MSKFWIEPLTDVSGAKHWLLFEHGEFHKPTAVLTDTEAKTIARLILAVNEANIPTDIGKRLSEYRRKHNLGLRDVAELTGVSAATLSRIENGHEQIEHDTYLKLVETLGREW